MKGLTIACLAGVAFLAACSSDPTTGTADGTAGAGGPGAAGAGYGAGGVGGADGRGVGAAGLGGAALSGPGSQEDLVQSAGDKIFFGSDQTSLSEQARSTLNRQAEWLQRNPQVNVWVAGNCDERGTEEYNLALGQRRANADRDYLVAQGVARSRIETISYGKARPIDPDSNAQAWAQNRNAVTSVR